MLEGIQRVTFSGLCIDIARRNLLLVNLGFEGLNDNIDLEGGTSLTLG